MQGHKEGGKVILSKMERGKSGSPSSKEKNKLGWGGKIYKWPKEPL